MYKIYHMRIELGDGRSDLEALIGEWLLIRNDNVNTRRSMIEQPFMSDLR